MALPASLKALRHRNFRLLWIGLLISLSGSMMRNAALLWHVAMLAPEGEKAFALGILGLVRVVPIVVFSFISGIVADALNRQKLMVLTNVGSMLVSAALAWVTFTRIDSMGLVYALAGLSSAMGAFDGPARQSLFPSLVPREHLSNAISLNSIMFQTARVLGPLVCGWVIATRGVAWVYAVDSISFGALIVTLLSMRGVPQRTEEERSKISIKAGWEGFRFVFSQPLIRSSMLLDFFATFFADAMGLLPIFALDILHVNAQGYGLLMSAPAIGAILTSLVMVPTMERITQRGRVLIGAVLIYGLATVGFGLSTSFTLTFACLFVSGAADMISTVLRNVIRQLNTPDGMRGRMTAINMMFFMGGPQLGELEAGMVAQWLGPMVSVVSGGIGCIAASGIVAWRTPGLAAYRREEHGDSSTVAVRQDDRVTG